MSTDSGEDGALQRVAFVAMPFGRKPTGSGSAGPQTVDFDALWSRAFAPALTALGYLAIRADNQVGSVIVKDMLEQLVHADLVLADVSVANGNVYYELGVRHGVREAGCVLLRAEWSRPLFDLAQITQLLYPFPRGEPGEVHYEAVRRTLVAGIPGLVASRGPVWALVPNVADAPAQRSSRVLKEVERQLFDFTHRLLTARLAASGHDKAPLRALLASEQVADLPDYALRDVVAAAVDHLTGREVLNLIARLDERTRDDPFIREQEAHARSRVGEMEQAIALLETVNERHGPTPERLVSIGAFYGLLAEESRRGPARRKHHRRAVQAFRDGMTQDLNDHRPPRHLLTELMRAGEDAADEEKAEAGACAAVLRAAVDRAVATGAGDDLDLDAARLVLAIHDRDAGTMCRQVDAVLGRDVPVWRLTLLVRAVDTALAWVPEAMRTPFDAARATLAECVPVPQDRLLGEVLPRLREEGATYRKTLGVDARPAREGEVVVSVTSDGEETTNVARPGDMLVRARTGAREEYLVGAPKFAQRYEKETPADAHGFAGYQPRGRVLGLEITRDITDLLGVGEEFFLLAPWGSEQFAREGDMLVSPLPDLGEVYRIGRREFEETYTLDPAADAGADAGARPRDAGRADGGASRGSGGR